jgi:hypothetical protein
MRSTTDTLGMAIPSAAKAALLSIRAARLKPCPDDCKTRKPSEDRPVSLQAVD